MATSFLRQYADAVGHWQGLDDDGDQIVCGSCWAVGDHLVATNYHVAAGPTRATVNIQDGEYKVRGLVAWDQSRDIAIARLQMGRSKLKVPYEIHGELPEIGSEIYVIGNPENLVGTVTKGIISAIRPAESLAAIGVDIGSQGDYLLQLDAGINSGSSGGPIALASGGVVGMAVFSIAESEALHFAIPSRYVLELLSGQGIPVPLSEFRDDIAEAVDQLIREFATLPDDDEPETSGRFSLDDPSVLAYALCDKDDLAYSLLFLGLAMFSSAEDDPSLVLAKGPALSMYVAFVTTEIAGWEAPPRDMDALKDDIRKHLARLWGRRKSVPFEEAFRKSAGFVRDHIPAEIRANLAYMLQQILLAGRSLDPDEFSVWRDLTASWNDVM